MKNYFIHENGICESEDVGAGTKVWAFSHVLSGAKIGADCNICDQVFIENDVVIGNRVTIKCGVQIWDGVRVGDDVFIGPNATFTNDPFPRSKQYPVKFLETVIEKGASIGANATILPGVKIGAEAMVGAGAVVTSNVPPKAIVFGNPARIRGYTSTDSFNAVGLMEGTVVSNLKDSTERVVPIGVGEAALYHLPNFKDLRGSLTAVEFPSDLPFIPERYFTVYNVPSEKVRGEHAHHRCKQLLIAVHGALSVVMDDGLSAKEIRLDTPNIGLYLPEMTWGIQYKFSHDSVLLVLASLPYSSGDYIRSYGDFISFAKGKDV